MIKSVSTLSFLVVVNVDAQSKLYGVVWLEHPPIVTPGVNPRLIYRGCIIVTEQISGRDANRGRLIDMFMDFMLLP